MTEGATATAARMRITGAALTERHRELVLEGAWDVALRGLLGSLDGMTVDQAYAVLRGDSRLEGDSRSGVTLVGDEGSAGYREELAGMHDDVLLAGGRHWRPYGAVPETRRDARDEDPRRRALALRRSPADRVERLNVPESGPAYVLFEPVDRPPAWLEPERSAQALVARLCADGRGPPKIAAEAATPDGDAGRGWRTFRAAAAPADAVGDAEDGSGASSRRPAWLAREPDSERAIAWYRARVAEIAATHPAGWIELSCVGATGPRTLRIPRAPFERWALRGTAARDLAPEWETVSAPSLKMENDDPVHTDWMLGAGLELHELATDRALRAAVEDEVARIQAARLGHACAVISGGGTGVAVGRAVHPRRGDEPVPPGAVVVLPSLDARFLPAILAACGDGGGAVVAEAGGEAAHLVGIGRERAVRILRLPEARRLLPEGTLVRVDPDAGEAGAEDGAEDGPAASGARGGSGPAD